MTRSVWNSLGTPRAVRFISLCMVLYLLVLGFQQFAIYRINSCLADYANASAVSTNARAAAAGQDRQLDQQEQVLDQADRDANRSFSKALSQVLNSITKSRSEQRAAYENLLKVDAATSKTLDDNTRRRAEIAKQRAAAERQRQLNPVPPPPSSC